MRGGDGPVRVILTLLFKDDEAVLPPSSMYEATAVLPGGHIKALPPPSLPSAQASVLGMSLYIIICTRIDEF